MTETREDMIKLITVYENFCNPNRASTNVGKTKYLIYRRALRENIDMHLADFDDDLEQDEEKRESMKKARLIYHNKTKVPFYQRIGIVTKTHHPLSGS